MVKKKDVNNSGQNIQGIASLSNLVNICSCRAITVMLELNKNAIKTKMQCEPRSNVRQLFCGGYKQWLCFHDSIEI